MQDLAAQEEEEKRQRPGPGPGPARAKRDRGGGKRRWRGRKHKEVKRLRHKEEEEGGQEKRWFLFQLWSRQFRVQFVDSVTWRARRSAFRFDSRIHLLKSPRKVFGKRRQKPSFYRFQAGHRSDLLMCHISAASPQPWLARTLAAANQE